MADEGVTAKIPPKLPAEPCANCPSKRAFCASPFWEKLSQGQMTAVLKGDTTALRFGGVQICKESGSLDGAPRALINSSKVRGERLAKLSARKGARVCWKTLQLRRQEIFTPPPSARAEQTAVTVEVCE